MTWGGCGATSGVFGMTWVVFGTTWSAFGQPSQPEMVQAMRTWRTRDRRRRRQLAGAKEILAKEAEQFADEGSVTPRKEKKMQMERCK